LLVGHFVRPDSPNEEKLEIYECGEPTIGSSFVQFDLRFYVIALVFIIFDVEVAFLFPWATVFGKAANLANSDAAVVQMVDGTPELTASTEAIYRELGVRQPALASSLAADAETVVRAGALDLAGLALVAGAIFFTVLFVGFAYEWKTGALDWVRAIRGQFQAARRRPPPTGGITKSSPQESVLSA
jgi:NADH-quinone oxidoreductase subunit A